MKEVKKAAKRVLNQDVIKTLKELRVGVTQIAIDAENAWETAASQPVGRIDNVALLNAENVQTACDRIEMKVSSILQDIERILAATATLLEGDDRKGECE